MEYFYLTDPGKVRDHNEDSVIIVKNESGEILLAVADNNTPLMKEITIPGTGFSFVLVEKNMNLVFKQKSLLDTKLPTSGSGPSG